MKNTLIIICLISISIISFGQTIETNNNSKTDNQTSKEEIYLVVEEMPSYPGGEAKMYKHISDNLNYPDQAINAKVKGTVYVTFTIDKNGEVKNTKVLKGIGFGCDEEAVRIINTMPKWKPGKQKGKPVQVQYRMPIEFSYKKAKKKKNK